MRACSIGIIVTLCMQASGAQAGLHLGMKLACKRYGEAWNSGSRGALASVATPDFYHQWCRMPDESFARLPRGGRGKVLSSQKGCGSGGVTVATSSGVVTLALVGHGFHWQVCDIYKSGDDGRTVSLKSYLDATLTAREFLVDLKDVGGSSFDDSISPRMREAFAHLSADEIERVRKFLPDITKAPKPYVSLGTVEAIVQVQIPDGKPGDTLTFRLVEEGGWRVDDFAVDSHRTSIASFREALPIIASVSAFGSFVEDPIHVEPATFTTAGELRDALESTRQESPFPLQAGGVRQRFVIHPDLSTVEITYPNRQVRIGVREESGRRLIESVEIMLGSNWTSVATLLSARKSLRLFAGAGSVERWVGARSEAVSSTPASALASSSATETAPASPAPQAEAAVQAGAAEPVIEAALAQEPVGAAQAVESAHHAQPESDSTPAVRPVDHSEHQIIHRHSRGKWRIRRRCGW